MYQVSKVKTDESEPRCVPAILPSNSLKAPAVVMAIEAITVPAALSISQIAPISSVGRASTLRAKDKNVTTLVAL